MSNYTKATNFATKDTLPTGDSGKIIKGTEIDTEFNAIVSAVATKADIASPTFTGTPAAPTATSGTNTTQLATTAFVTGAVTTERTTAATLTNKTITSPVINEIVHEGTANDFETTLVFTDPTADRTITFPDKAGTVAMTSELPSATALFTSSGTYAIAGSTTLTVTSTAHGRAVDDVVYLNFTSGTAVDDYYTIVTVPTANTFTVTHGTSITSSGNVTGYYSNLGLISIASAEETIKGISTNQAVTPDSLKGSYNTTFATSQETNGYQKLPGGLIMQWGTTDVIPGPGTLDITFPIVFPTSCVNVQITIKDSSNDTSSTGIAAARSVTATGFTLRNGEDPDMVFNWLAIGY
jgi:hypothetical protein